MNRSALLLLAALLASQAERAAGLELPVAGARFQLASGSIKQLRLRGTVRQQYDFSCGSAALATLLTYHYGDPVSEQQIFDHMFLHGDRQKIRREGFSMLDMQGFLAARGWRADGFHLSLDKLAQSKLPAIVLVSDKGYRHFVVLKAIQGGRVLIGDPSRGTRAMPRADFEALWVGKLLFVIHGSPAKPLFNQASEWRAAPAAPLADAVRRDALGSLSLAKHGPGDF